MLAKAKHDGIYFNNRLFSFLTILMHFGNILLIVISKNLKKNSEIEPYLIRLWLTSITILRQGLIIVKELGKL